jgi:hypothetical protein
MKSKSIQCNYNIDLDYTLTPLKGRCGSNALNDIAQPCMSIPLTEAIYHTLMKERADYFRLGETQTVLVLASYAGQYGLMPLNGSAAYAILSKQ